MTDIPKLKSNSMKFQIIVLNDRLTYTLSISSNT